MHNSENTYGSPQERTLDSSHGDEFEDSTLGVANILQQELQQLELDESHSAEPHTGLVRERVLRTPSPDSSNVMLNSVEDASPRVAEVAETTSE